MKNSRENGFVIAGFVNTLGELGIMRHPADYYMSLMRYWVFKRKNAN